jgi:hypothetical protein
MMEYNSGSGRLRGECARSTGTGRLRCSVMIITHELEVFGTDTLMGFVCFDATRKQRRKDAVFEFGNS